MDKADWFTLINCMAPDEGERLTDEDRENALALAVIRYSTDRPRPEAADVVTEDGFTVPLPEGWQADFSRVTGIELPGGVPPDMLAGDAIGLGPERIRGGWRGGAPQWLTRDEWMPHRIPGRDVLLLVSTQKPGAELRVHYTLSHVLNAVQDTIPAKDREAVAHWAAGLLLDSLSGKHAGDTHSTINSDSVDHAGKMPNYKSLAEAQRQAYWNHLGIDPKRTVASGAVVTVGHRRLLHRGPHSRRRS
jgi:hypothetical protein